MDDWDILDLFFTRSEQAIVELDAKYGAIFHALAYNILASREDADECVNDAYLGAWNAIPPERPEHLGAWLGRVVRNVALGRWQHAHARKRNRGMTTLLSELEECIPSPQNVETALDEQELGERISIWLRSLPQE